MLVKLTPNAQQMTLLPHLNYNYYLRQALFRADIRAWLFQSLFTFKSILFFVFVWEKSTDFLFIFIYFCDGEKIQLVTHFRQHRVKLSYFDSSVFITKSRSENFTLFVKICFLFLNNFKEGTCHFFCYYRCQGFVLNLNKGTWVIFYLLFRFKSVF